LSKAAELKNKPLIEAIFELRWHIAGLDDGFPERDPKYSVLPGQLFDRLQSEYPVHEELPSVAMSVPVPYLVQHRYRKDHDEWPLVQLGPGIVTLNETVGYSWPDFASRIGALVAALSDAYPELPQPVGLLLRYQNGMAFDFDNDDCLEFLRDKMGVTLSLNTGMFESGIVSNSPLGVDSTFTLVMKNLPGVLGLRFTRAERNGEPLLVWELLVQSLGPDVPKSESGLIEWTEHAHAVIEEVFFELIDGDLRGRFE
jgi:uncharacterized protein (TIGR04255 family)